MEKQHLFFRSAEVNGTKPKSLRASPEMPYRQQKSRARESPYSALNSFLWVFSATILRPLTSARNYATIADRKRQNSRGICHGNKTNERKLCAAAKAAADPQADQRGRLRAAALSRRRKLRFWAACFRNPPVLLRYVSSSQKIFALQIFFGSPVSLGFPCCSCCLFRGVCLAAAGEARRTCLCQAHATVPK